MYSVGYKRLRQITTSSANFMELYDVCDRLERLVGTKRPFLHSKNNRLR